MSRSSNLDEERPRHVVFANWRDRRHPQAGGAELYCESVARRMVQRGVKVTLLTSRPPGLPSEEVIEGVNIRRAGGTFTVYLHALAWLHRHRRHVDAVIDCQNGIPFFSPLVTKRSVPVVCLVFHIHQEQFATYFSRPMARVGRWLEGPVSRAVYGWRTIAVISPSTRAGVRTRLKLRGAVHVAPCGADQPIGRLIAGVRPAPQPYIVCVGRLVPHKRMELLLEAIPGVVRDFPQLSVSIVGSGPQLEPMERRAQQLGIAGRVRFHGQLSDDIRERLLTEAWLTVNPSAGEGWGLSVIEANALGVPAVAFRVPGLQDSIVHCRTGWLVEPGAPLATTIAEALTTLSHPDSARGFSERARAWAAGFSWDTTTDRLLGVIAEEKRRLSRASAGRATEQRRPSDVACHVSLPADLCSSRTLASSFRQTDVWVRSGDRIEALMPSADEWGARVALERIGAANSAQVRIARPTDWLLAGSPLS